MPDHTIQNLFVAFQQQLDLSNQPLKNRKAIHAITHCRTREMGVSVYRCKDNHEPIEQYHSCRHRSCYLCAQKKRLEWIEQQKQRIFNTPHFHVIFTFPHEYLTLWRYNEALFSRILFKASQKTLLELMGEKKYGGVTPGILMTLHTWGRNLSLHPHIHCLVSSGGLTANNQWHAIGQFLLPGAVIRKVYRGKIQAELKAAFDAGKLHLPPNMSARQFLSLHRLLFRKDWHVRIEERYEHGKGVVMYLARYCKGGPINPKQIKLENRKAIEMRYLDHRSGRTRIQRLHPMTFIQHLLQHTPPQGLHTVRYYGLYSTASKQRHERCKELHGTVSGISSGHSSQILSMLLYCKTCGVPAQLSYQLWPSRRKGISINKDALQVRAGGYVQQVDESDHANALRNKDPCYSTG